MTSKVWYLTAAIAIIGCNSLMLSPLAATIAASYGLAGAANVMFASAAYGLGTALGALTLAPLADRLGAGRVLPVGLAVLTIAFLASAIAPNLASLVLAQGLAGMAAGLCLPAIYTLAAVIAPEGRESETLGIVLTGWTVSLVGGVGLAAIGADFFQWRSVYWVMAGLTALIGVSVLTLRNAQSGGSTPTSPLTALRVPGIGSALGVCAAYMIAFYATYTFLGAHIVEALGRSTLAAGFMPVAYGFGFGIAVLLDRWIDRLGEQRLELPVFAGLALTYVALALLASDYRSIIALSCLWGLVNHLGINLIVKRLGALDPSQRGAIMGLYSALTYLCVTIAALSFRPIYIGYGIEVCAWLSAVAVGLGLLLIKRRQRLAA